MGILNSSPTTILITDFANSGIFTTNIFYGYPLMHSNRQIEHFKNIDDLNYQTIGNNRLWAHHISAQGHLTEKLYYIAKTTFSKNFGTYNGFYTSGFNERPNYYFREGKYQNYFLLELSQQLPRNFRANVAFGFDSGELYESVGFRVGISWFILPLK